MRKITKKEFFADILKEDLNVVESFGHYERTITMLNLVYTYAILGGKKVFLFCNENPKSYYTSRLLSIISKIPIYIAQTYCDPYLPDSGNRMFCEPYFPLGENEEKKIKDRDLYMDTLEKIITSKLDVYCDGFIDIFLYDEESAYDETYMHPDLVLVENVSFLKKSFWQQGKKLSEVEVIEMLKRYAEKHHTQFVLFSTPFWFSEDLVKRRLFLKMERTEYVSDATKLIVKGVENKFLTWNKDTFCIGEEEE